MKGILMVLQNVLNHCIASIDGHVQVRLALHGYRVAAVLRQGVAP